jgi:Protein of unknown function (DUF1091)
VDNVARVSVWIVTKKVLADIRISEVGNAKNPKVVHYKEFLKGSLDYCSLSSSFFGQTVLKYYTPIIEQYGNFTVSCPLPIGSAYINFPLTAVKLPPFIPIQNVDFLLKVYIKTKLPGKRPTRICDLVITGTLDIDQSNNTNTTKL